jgi:hypothetical protein
MDALVQMIEAYLLQRACWVPARELCERFGLNERALRQDGDRPGLCSAFAISGVDGIKHVSLGTTKECLEFFHTLTRHGISELRRVRALRRRRHGMARQIRRPAVIQERDTPQLLRAAILPTDSGASGSRWRAM